MSGEMIGVTSRLFLGPPEAAGIWPDLIPVETAADARTVIMCRLSALLPPDAWDVAEEFLRLAGADAAHIDFVLRVARGDIDGLPCHFGPPADDRPAS